ncbi:bifunctional adenosylcobinamide kinase/adenosylcobinamide-phosphate guanylyltransferase [Robertmurraya massiliosenegalensis]|uniref:bifunctional adenosylcobinamide kinase/adenosylcobinamide-phosphate guanylyltransferase n=1 Tax=Robertmurraya massiliosenegalensis TaxID=1287657 RepID=UPI0003030451|nr:bifunctional adenosylcobinamide kinase/adenosylcobinamide-phosphate guanylyltransferase [Robertmurraya massiliosenegalensis]
MHFVTGGAFNGKSKWVRTKFPEAKWISAYSGESESFPEEAEAPVVVLEGMEQWVKASANSREEWTKVLEKWLEWEQVDSSRYVIFIGTDISKGIVPIEKEHRDWRDRTGWVYQDLVALCKQVDVIWYGINQTIKEEVQ